MGIGLLVLLAWPLVVIVLFRTLPFRDSLIWSIVAGFLFLPSHQHVGINLPVLPALDKRLVPALAAALVALVALSQARTQQARRRGSDTLPGPDVDVLPGWLPRSTLGIGLLTVIVLGLMATALTNGDAQFFGPRRLPPQSLYDAFSALLSIGVLLLPLLLGRKFLSDDQGHKRLLVVLFISAMIYTLPALYEVRMSPQVNRMVYDFFPHSWRQHIRAGGWRPLVFLDHGLLLGIHFACALIAGTIMVRMEKSGRRLLYIVCVLWLAGALVLAKTLGALIIAILLLPVAFLMPVRLQLMVAAGIALITVMYPILRGSGLVPTEAIVEMAEGIDEARAGSLEFRFENEDVLLDRANERPTFGWGWWARARVYDEEGRDISITDGTWIIAIGETGWIGYIGQFGLLTFPIMLFFLRRRRYEIGLATSGLCLVTGANLIDLLPNASLTPVLMLCAGALLGRLERVRDSATATDPPPQEAVPGGGGALARVARTPAPGAEMTRYSRFPVRKRPGSAEADRGPDRGAGRKTGRTGRG
jgi:hypothetical protein